MMTEPIEIVEALCDLRNGSISQDDYRVAVQTDRMVCFEQKDDLIFAAVHPEHPMNSRNRMRRIAASDRIRALVQEDPSGFSPEHMSHLHAAAFDCCAAVRLSIVATLAILNRHESLFVLEELASHERESEWVRSAAQDAIRVMKGEITLADSPQLHGLAPKITSSAA